MKRRNFLTSVVALSVCGKTAFAHSDAEHDRRIGPSVVPPEHLPREVEYSEAGKPGEIHVDPNQFALFWTLPNHRAIRYTVGIGREGLYESGEFYVARKQKWPRWTPTPAMISREPSRYLRFAGGVPGGAEKSTGCKSVVPLSTGSRRHIPKDSRNHGPEDDRSTRLERLREAHEQPNCRAIRASPAPDACCAQTYRHVRTAKNARRALIAIHIVTKNQPPSY